METWQIALLIFLLFDLLLVVFVVIKKKLARRFTHKELEFIRSNWMRVLDMYPNNPKGAIIDADKILDYALSRQGFEGTLGEKLKKAGARFSDINGVWVAHKLRNRLAHELTGNLADHEGRQALASFKTALKDLGAKL